MNTITGKHHPKPEHTQKPEPTKSPCPEPTQTPSPTPEPTVTPTPEPTVTPEPTSTPTPTVTPREGSVKPTAKPEGKTTIGTPVFPETNTSTAVPEKVLANTGADAATLPLTGGALLAVVLGVVLLVRRVRRGH